MVYKNYMLKLRPNSALSWMFYIFLIPFATIALRVGWILATQNIENFSTEKGYDKLLSRHWSEVTAWMQDNIFWWSHFIMFFFGGVIALALVSIFGKKFPAKNTITKQVKFRRLSRDIFRTYQALQGNFRQRQSSEVSPETNTKIKVIHAQLKKLGIETPSAVYGDDNYKKDNLIHLYAMYEYARKGLLREAKKAANTPL